MSNLLAFFLALIIMGALYILVDHEDTIRRNLSFIFSRRNSGGRATSPQTDEDEGGPDTSFRNMVFWAIVIIIHIILFVFIVFAYESDKEILGLNKGVFYTWLLVGFDLMSIYVINPDEVGARTVLGFPINGFGAGPRYVPLLLCRLYRDTLRVIQLNLPGEPGRIWHGDPNQRPQDIDPKTGEDKYVLPFSFRTGYPLENDTAPNNPLNIQATIEPSVLLRFQIEEDKYASLFIKNIVSIKEAKRQVEDTVAFILQSEFSSRTVGVVVTELHLINAALKTELERLVKSWGVAIRDVSIKTIGLSE